MCAWAGRARPPIASTAAQPSYSPVARSRLLTTGNAAKGATGPPCEAGASCYSPPGQGRAHMLPDRELQRTILERLRDVYPSPLETRLLFENFDSAIGIFNLR